MSSGLAYYVVDARTNNILQVVYAMNEDIVLGLADIHDTDVYVIEGQRTGYHASPPPKSTGECRWCELRPLQGTPIKVDGVYIHHVFNEDRGRYEIKSCEKKWRK